MLVDDFLFLAVLLATVAWRCWINLRVTQLKFWKAACKTAWELMRIVGVVVMVFTLTFIALLGVGTMTFYEAWTILLSIAIHGVTWSCALALIVTFPLVFVQYWVTRRQAGM